MYTVFGQGVQWSARERVLGTCVRRLQWSGAVGKQTGGLGHMKRSENEGGV